jgi:hypothetical protein
LQSFRKDLNIKLVEYGYGIKRVYREDDLDVEARNVIPVETINHIISIMELESDRYLHMMKQLEIGELVNHFQMQCSSL